MRKVVSIAASVLMTTGIAQAGGKVGIDPGGPAEDLMVMLDDGSYVPADVADVAGSRRPPIPPGLEKKTDVPGQGKVNFGDLIISGLRAGVQPTESISLNGKPGAGGDEGGVRPGGGGPGGMDPQGTEAQGAERD
ncbi:MAG TPA: hypothetical protein VJT77_06485 [Burkholderiales bacterium]|nr:hypothetical protein [Burkholderiales bacterium]